VLPRRHWNYIWPCFLSPSNASSYFELSIDGFVPFGEKIVCFVCFFFHLKGRDKAEAEIALEKSF
jgi:hypothetical protein